MTDLLTRIEQNKPVEAQELYDYIVEAIVKQGRPSVGDNDRCLYRGPDGLKCAYGHVHPDSMYSEDMEDSNIQRLNEMGRIPKSLLPHIDLLLYMQRNHDGTHPGHNFLSSFLSYSNLLATMFSLKPYGNKT